MVLSLITRQFRLILEIDAADAERLTQEADCGKAGAALNLR